jgi:hypothetical protein
MRYGGGAEFRKEPSKSKKAGMAPALAASIAL